MQHFTFSPQTMSHSKPITPVITPTHHDHPRTNLVPWKVAINRARRVRWMGYLRVPVRCIRRRGLGCPQHPPRVAVAGQTRFPGSSWSCHQCWPCCPYKRATDARATWLACSAAFYVAILESIGKSNHLAISDPDTDTLHLSREISSMRWLFSMRQ